jgi:hypothetical protein
VYARIARFEAADADRVQQMADQIRGEAGLPEGVRATRFMLLLGRSGGTSLAISFFESDEDGVARAPRSSSTRSRWNTAVIG